jgi:lambda family phage portal protein
VTETADNGNRVKQGVEFNEAGVPVAYNIWPNHPSDTLVDGGYKRVEADRVLHVFEQYRPRCVRGLSRTAPVSRTFEALAQYLDFELARARISSAFVAAVKKQGGFRLNWPSTGNAADEEDANDNPVGYLEGGMILNLRPGEDISFGGAEIQTAFESFVTLMLRSVAVGLNVSYELLARDFSKTNYSSARQSALEDRKHWRPRQKLRLRQWSRPCWGWFIEQLKLQNVIAGLDRLDEIPAIWKLPGWQWIDPSKELDAVEKELLIGTRAPQDILADRGIDWSETLRRRKQAEEDVEEMGLSFSWTKSASGNGNGAPPGEPEEPEEPEGDGDET